MAQDDEEDGLQELPLRSSDLLLFRSAVLRQIAALRSPDQPAQDGERISLLRLVYQQLQGMERGAEGSGILTGPVLRELDEALGAYVAVLRQRGAQVAEDEILERMQSLRRSLRPLVPSSSPARADDGREWP